MSGQAAPVFIVDDDDAVRDSLRIYLESRGLEVRDFASPGALLAACGAPRDGCLVLDFQLPSMDGLALLKLLRDRAIDLPAVLVTAQTDPQIRARARKAGIAAFLEKPFDGPALLAVVQEAMRRRPPRSDNLEAREKSIRGLAARRGGTSPVRSRLT
jgi:two-component system, LuxR family, response regulator FixJ